MAQRKLSLESKVFNDPVHGHIKIHPLCVKIIDTPQFQRLRNIKQLDSVYFVYPGAAHNRFEHSIGVCHLAERFVRELQNRQPELEITEVDVRCVMIAGLCHDLGHGPFSHLFERFMARMVPARHWKHEEASVKMFNHMIEKNKLERDFQEYGIQHLDLQFIEEQISGKKKDPPGRGRNKEFLYEIVNNQRHGIDVDRLDYFPRDCLMLGIGNTFDRNRFIQMTRVIEIGGETRICFRDKEADHIYDMFYQLAKLVRQAYQHKTTFVIGDMIIEALAKANDNIKLRGGKSMIQAVDDMEAFTELTDDVIQRIMYSADRGLDASRQKLTNIKYRELHKFVAETHPHHPTYKYIQGNELILAQELARDQDFTVDDIVVQIVKLDLGSGENNPLENVLFFTKNEPDIAIRGKAIFQAERNLELIIRVFSKRRDDAQFNQNLKELFKDRLGDDELVRRLLPPVAAED